VYCALPSSAAEAEQGEVAETTFRVSRMTGAELFSYGVLGLVVSTG
jgi:hypothetical protein